ncbi:MAG: hypothetical protein KDC38_03570 [Planctomycetes bacterium]|nr:hypothetical protein [Planctomycetota bacterium]
MSNLRLIVGLTLVLSGLGVTEARGQNAPAPAPGTVSTIPVIPSDNGAAVQGLLYSRSFTLATPFTFWWNAQQPQVAEGTILVFDVDPEYVRPRQIGVPVLYVGDTPAMVVNQGYVSGRLVVIVPGRVDLATTPVFFGSVELPERVDSTRGQAEMRAALDMGILPFDADTIAVATENETLETSDLDFLMLAVSDLVLDFCPDEAELAVALAMAAGQ